MSRNKFAGWVALFFVTSACVGCRTIAGAFIDLTPPGSQTYGALVVTSVRIRDYWNLHGKVPIDPSEMPVIPDRDCEMIDDWGRPLHWKSDGESVVRVWSLGRDDKIGGEGEDEDWEFTFDGKLAHLEELTKIRKGKSNQ